LPATKIRIPFLRVCAAFSATDRHAVQRKNPSFDVLPLAVVLAAVTDRNGEACEGRITLGIAQLGIVGDVSD
jgi:hypothetical protein